MFSFAGAMEKCRGCGGPLSTVIRMMIGVMISGVVALISTVPDEVPAV